MLLQRDEGVLRSEYAVLIGGEGTGLDRRRAGVLYLTNHRLLFESHQSRGVMRGRDPVILLDAPLFALTNVSVRRPTLGKPRLVVESGRVRAAFDVLGPDEWVSSTAEARQALAPPHGTVATHTIERQVVKVRCRFCGRLGDERDGQCPACGAPL
jgi:hypothetical protein